jgi:PAS domain S-box-containing protein
MVGLAIVGYISANLSAKMAREAALAEEREKLRHEAANRASQAEGAQRQISETLESISDAFVAIDGEWRFTYVNRQAEQILGRKRDDLVGKNMWEVFPEVVGSEVFKELHRAKDERVPVELEYLNSEANVWYELRAFTSGDGLSVYFRDITERKRADQERERLLGQIESERRRLEVILEVAPVGAIVVDAEGRIVIANRSAAILSGLSTAQVGFDFPPGYQVLLPSGTPYSRDEFPLMLALSNGQSVLGAEIMVRRPDGETVSLLANSTPIRNPEGDIAGAVAIFMDITQLRGLEREREEFISVVAHDLRGALTAIRGHADLLLRRTAKEALPEAFEQSLKAISGSTRGMTRMVADLLDVSRIESSRLALAKAAVDLPSRVRAVIERLRESNGGLPVKVEVRGTIPMVKADPDRVDQILTNLLSNAGKYSYPNTEITVEVELLPDGGETMVSVTNLGPGIEPEEKDRLFSRFHRARQAREERVPGLGLGLYIAKGLVEAHGGRIWFESESERYTTFRFTLPVSIETE